MLKKVLLVLVSVMMIFSVASVAAASETSEALPKVVFNVSQPDADGFFFVDLTVYNATFKGFIADLKYNAEVVAPVDKETKEVTDDFSKMSEIPAKAYDLETNEEIAGWLSSSIKPVRNNEISLIFALNSKVKYPNTIVTPKFQALAKEEGITVSKMYFKKVADGDFGFELIPESSTGAVFALVNSSGMLGCEVEINYPEGVGESVKTVVEEVTLGTKVSDESETDAETLKKRVQGRSNATVFLQIDNYATVSDSILKWVDRDNKAVMPYIKNDYTMVPLRYIAEQLNSKVSYNAETQEITIENSRTVLVFKVGSLEYTNDGLKKVADVAPEIVNDRTFVPLRTVSEALNRAVTWLEADRIVVITSKDYPWAEENKVEKELLKEIKLMISPMIRDYAYINQ